MRSERRLGTTAKPLFCEPAVRAASHSPDAAAGGGPGRPVVRGLAEAHGRPAATAVSRSACPFECDAGGFCDRCPPVRNGPNLTEARPGDARDTTSSREIGKNYERIVLGEALPANERAFLRGLLKNNQTPVGRARIKAGLPPGWTIADKTGTGRYGTTNDIAIVWPPNGAPPLVIAVMSAKDTEDASGDDAPLAEAAAHVVAR